jgi:hypothetical protein
VNKPPQNIAVLEQRSASTFADLVDARFRARIEVERDGQEGPWSNRLVYLRARFEEIEGAIIREYWGVRLPLGLVLTERPRSHWKRLLYRPPKMYLHRAILHSESLPPEFYAALSDGDVLAVRARFSLGDLSRHTVLARIFEAESFLLNLVDAAEGLVVTERRHSRPSEPRSSAAKDS